MSSSDGCCCKQLHDLVETVLPMGPSAMTVQGPSLGFGLAAKDGGHARHAGPLTAWRSLTIIRMLVMNDDQLLPVYHHVIGSSD